MWLQPFKHAYMHVGYLHLQQNACTASCIWANPINRPSFPLSSDSLRLASPSWLRCSGQATEPHTRPSIIVAPRRKFQGTFARVCVTVYKVGEFCGFPCCCSMRASRVAFKNRWLHLKIAYCAGFSSAVAVLTNKSNQILPVEGYF